VLVVAVIDVVLECVLVAVVGVPEVVLAEVVLESVVESVEVMFPAQMPQNMSHWWALPHVGQKTVSHSSPLTSP
jgi:hypothetical protein